MGIRLMALTKVMILITLSVISISVNSYASECTIKSCNGLMLPASTQKFISKGYEDIEIKEINNNRYLFLSSRNDVNKCSVVFKIDDNQIESAPSAGESGSVCNVSEINGKVVSSYRDQGMWFDDIYLVSSGKHWTLLFSDSCTDCQQVKRTYYKNGIENRTELLSGGDNYSSRKPLKGVIIVQKSSLYSQSDEHKKIKSYLIKGDTFILTDMSEDGDFYQINYTSQSGKNSLYWIKTDSFDLKK